MEYRGKLNQFVTADIRLSRNGERPRLKQDGDPLKGETLFVDFTDMMDTDLQLRLTLTEPFFVDGVRLTLAPKTALTAVALYAGEQLLARHCAETDSTISCRELFLSAGVETDCLTLVFSGELSGVGLENLEIFGSSPALPALYPTPADARFDSRWVSAERFAGCVCDCDDAKTAAEILNEKLTEKTGCCLSFRGDGAVRIFRDAAIPADGYTLSVTEEAVCLSASNLRGFTYGAETLSKLIHDGKLPLCHISDRPRMPFRGVHLMLPSEENIPFFKRVVKYILSPMGYNCIFLQLSAGMEFKSHPEINEAYVQAVQNGRSGKWPSFPHNCVADGQFISQDQVRDLVSYCRGFGIDVIPEVQSLGHVQFMTLAHPEIAELEEGAPVYDPNSTDAREEDVRPAEFYPHCYCPSNERSYELLFDLLDEIIAVVQPREYVHMGHDEVYKIGVCPKCREKDPADLFASDINRIHAYLAEKGLKMMIWADMLQPVTKYKTPGAIDKIPRDIVLLDFIWYFHMDKDIEDNLLSKGFQVMLGNMYSSHFPRYESRVVKPGIIGAEVSAWTTTNEDELGREGKLYDFLYSAEMLWSDTYDGCLRLSYDRILKTLVPAVRAQLQEQQYPSRQPDAARTLLLENCAEYPLCAAPEKTVCGAAGCFDSLVFEHSTVDKITRIPWIALRQVGLYEVEYADGTTREIPLTYGGNISHWNRRQNEPFRGGYYRHNGYSATYFADSVENKGPGGENICVYRYEWLNPKKDVPIRIVRLKQLDGQPRVFPHRIWGIRG